MSQTRRDVLKRIGTLGIASVGGAMVSSGTAAAKPSVDWEDAHPSNYTGANRGAGYIDWIIIHTVQGSASSAVNWFQNPDANVSAHYTVAQDGYRYQSVSDINIAWHAGGQNYNTWSIGIEHGGYVSGTYEDVQYRASAKLTSWLCDQYGVPKQHPGGVAPCDAANPANGGVIGHHQVPESDCGPNNHTDPGSHWDWSYYMDLVRSY
jgi:N-acetyl-anhydromuramyl-L-alanine amidase AmpD